MAIDVRVGRSTGPLDPAGHGHATTPDRVRTLAELARVLRELRRRHARLRGGPPLSYRELAAATGWSRGIIGEYLSGRVLPPTDRFDDLVRLLGATPAEQGALATARDRVEEQRRQSARPPTSAPVVDNHPSVPRQLPADVPGFTGRTAQLAALDTHQVTVSAICGTAGIGKTALAVHWAHGTRDRFPDGQLYLDLRGYDPDRPVSPADALATLLRGLGVDTTGIPADLPGRAALYRTLLAGRRMLVLLDNAYEAEQVRPLLPGSPPAVVVVTSRDGLAGLVARDGARRVDLDVLSRAEAAALLGTLLGARAAAEPGAVAELARRCGRLPLALRVAAEVAVAQPGRSLAGLVAELPAGAGVPDLLDATGDPRTEVRAVFSWSLRQLPEPVTQAFTLLGLYPGAQFDRYTLAALAAVDVDAAGGPLRRLARAHLVEAVGPGRYRMHDLLRAYAADLAAALDPKARGEAVDRLYAHTVAAAAAARDVLFPHDSGQSVATPDASTWVAPPAEPRQAQRWLDRQRPDLVSLALHAARAERGDVAAALSTLLWRYFEVGGHHQDALAVHTAAVRTTEHPAALINLANVQWWLGSYADARTHFQAAADGFQAIADASGQGRALARLAMVHERLGAYGPALDCLRQALAVYRTTGDRHGEASQLLNRGSLYRRLGRPVRALAHHRRAAGLFAQVGDARLEGYALGNLGATLLQLGRVKEALAPLRRALVHCRDAGDPAGMGSARATLGAAYRVLGRPARAHQQLEQALDLARRTGDRGLETETLNALGETLLDLARPADALERHRAALAVTARTGDRCEHARALDGMAAALDASGDRSAAHDHWTRALAVYTDLGLPQADRVRDRLAQPT
ncbi:ATP-binding protein [Catellatospora tritici]|uniref:ATP-binding protein n=1 Tax=Catellatospora tritici TaxID=2851566 RepID=UPI001C2D9FF6|nr:tetratricopeptide repeat protein [Catellatospora tritici]MBV1854780.1 tetratricopeptide repeat protein [Catellatospora tritici]